MRRRRHKLEVSTFPFLAVLLCAMGSLILMLLVLDRRAKAAARERAQRAAEQVEAEELKIAEQRREEWEKRRQALHKELLGQEEELTGRIAGVQKQIAVARAELEAERKRQKDERERIQIARDKLAHREETLRHLRGETANADEKAQDSQQELRRLAGELQALERTLDELKALRKRQQNTYSVVPYRGRRGDNRAPLYLECAASGLIFHPDKKTIGSPRTAGAEVKAEVQRRVMQQRATLSASGSTPPATPYLLLLVRPDGISTYYLTLKSLQGLDLDFGYELIDANWVLEFPSDGDTAKPQPWTVTERPTSPSAPSSPSPRPAPAGLSRGMGNGTGNAATGGTGSSAPAGGGAETAWRPAGGSIGHGGPGRSGLTSNAAAASPGSVEAGARIGPPVARGGGAPAGVAFGGPANTGSGTVIPGALAPGFGQPGGGTIQSAGSSGPGSENRMLSNASPAGNRLPAENSAPVGTSAGSTAPGGTPNSPTPLPASVSKTARETGNPATGTAAPSGQPASATSGTSRRPLEGPNNDLVKSKRATRPPVVRPALLGGDRDYLILVECRADRVVLHPFGNSFSAESLAKENGGGQLLQEAISRLIARRQATVRPGEQPYRPQVRFLVRPDGLRSLYRAYPVLETLHIPLSRQNLDSDEEIVPGDY